MTQIRVDYRDTKVVKDNWAAQKGASLYRKSGNGTALGGFSALAVVASIFGYGMPLDLLIFNDPQHLVAAFIIMGIMSAINLTLWTCGALALYARNSSVTSYNTTYLSEASDTYRSLHPKEREIVQPVYDKMWKHKDDHYAFQKRKNVFDQLVAEIQTTNQELEDDSDIEIAQEFIKMIRENRQRQIAS